METRRLTFQAKSLYVSEPWCAKRTRAVPPEETEETELKHGLGLNLGWSFKCNQHLITDNANSYFSALISLLFFFCDAPEFDLIGPWRYQLEVSPTQSQTCNAQ